MLLIRALFLAALVLIHVAGGAALFRRWFPRESPWFGLVVPIFAVVAVLNFAEHRIALPDLAWLLPISTLGSVLALVRLGRRARALRFPLCVFTGAFLFTFAMKCLQPDINFYFTEGLTDTNRVLNFCLGDRLPPTDSWLPPYPHTGYYTFMHYGASVLKRWLSIDVGTAVNVSSALVSALSLTAAGAAAYSLSRGRTLVTIVVVATVAGGFTGSSPAVTLFNPQNPDPVAAIDIGGGVDDPVHGIFAAMLRSDQPETSYRLYTPGCYIYYPEFHATMAGELIALWSVFAVAELLRRRRSLVPWILLAVAPLLALICCPWVLFIVIVVSALSLSAAWWLGRRPRSLSHVAAGAAAGVILLWPACNDLACGSTPLDFHWTTSYSHERWSFLVQWWPIYIPWVYLSFFRRRLNPSARWLHFLVLPVLITTESFYFFERGTMLEKTWGAAFAIGMASLYPSLFALRFWTARVLAFFLLLTALASAEAWIMNARHFARDSGAFCYLEGDHFIRADPVLSRLKEVLCRLHGEVVITGVPHRAFFESPCLPAFTGNRCYLGWTNAEETCGHPNEANYRQQQLEAFFAAKLPQPLRFLRANHISAVVVWPDDKIAGDWIEQMQTALAPDYSYVDCKGAGDSNAGVFLRETTVMP